MNNQAFWSGEGDTLAAMALAIEPKTNPFQRSSRPVRLTELQEEVELLANKVGIQSRIVHEWATENELSALRVHELHVKYGEEPLRVLLRARLKPEPLMLTWLQRVSIPGRKVTTFWTAEPHTIRWMPEELFISLVSQIESRASSDQKTIRLCYQILRHSHSKTELRYVKSVAKMSGGNLQRTTNGGKLERIANQYPSICF